MDIKEYLRIRVMNGKITVPDIDSSGKKIEESSYLYAKKYGGNMVEFWDNATTQKALLWAIRGLGLDVDADKLWNAIATRENITLHFTKITPEQSFRAACFIRENFSNPFKGNHYENV